MIVSPLDILNPVFHFLDGIIAEWGVYLPRLSVLVDADLVFSGGLRRKFPNQPHVNTGIGIIIQPHTPPPTIIIHDSAG